jgi:hypothetical protein
MLDRELVQPARRLFEQESGGICGSPFGAPLCICPECSAPGAGRELRGNCGGCAS